MKFDKLIQLVGCLDKRGKELFSINISSFFEESCFSSDFSSYFDEHKLDLLSLKEKIGEDTFQNLFMCAVEFFLSNEYPGDYESWNAIDSFLKKNDPFLSVQDKIYLNGLRESYMSIYEVIEVKLNKSITLRNLLDENHSQITVQEKKGTHFICQWDFLGARVVKTSNKSLLSGGLLLLSRDTANEAMEIIHKIVKVMMRKKTLRFFQEKTKDPVLMIKKMWTKEIAQAWFEEQMQLMQEPTLFNYDGDKLEFYTIEFSLKKPITEIVKAINHLPELKQPNIVKNSWIWPIKETESVYKKKEKTKEKLKTKEVFVDTHLSYEDGENIRIFAELKIEGKKLIIDVNSEQRANIVEDFFKTNLTSFFEKPIRTLNDLKSQQEEMKNSKDLKTGFSVEGEEKLKEQFFDQHYRNWLDSPLPALKGKTPRAAAKTKTGIQHVINLLKDMINMELQAVKQGIKTSSYNFDWVFSELNIDKNSL